MSNRDFYNENGFCVVKQLLPVDLVSNVLQDANKIASCKLSQLGATPLNFKGSDSYYENLKTLFSLDQQAYLGVVNLAAKLISLKTLALNSEIQQVVLSLGLDMLTKPTEAILHLMSHEFLLPGGQVGFKAHQDWPSIQGSLDSVAAWIPLTVVTQDSFPLEVIPKSHLHGLLDSKPNTYGILPGLYNEDEFVSVLVDPGDVVFMSSWTIHRTGTDPGTKFRVAISTRYENVMEPTYIERKFPNAYRRVVHRRPITPGFPSKQQVVNQFLSQGDN